jgi:hypothetical protein
MARIGLTLDRKFRRLSRALDDVQVGFGEVLARGALELLWDAAYEAADDFIGDVVDVEAAARWRGNEGVLLAALRDAGGEGRAGFIDEGGTEWWPDGKPGTYRVHDLWDHAPDFVKGRAERELAREEKGETISSLRAAAGRKGRAKQLGRASDGQPSGIQTATSGQIKPTCPPEPENSGQLTGKSLANLPTPPPRVAPGSPDPSLPRPHATRSDGGGRASGGTKLGPLGIALRAQCSSGLGYSLTPCDQARAARLEQLVEWFGGVDAAVGYVAATCRKRDVKPQSLSLVVDMLVDAAGQGAST